MGNLKYLFLAAGASFAMTAPAGAADLLPPPIIEVPDVIPAPVQVVGGWYLRGDIGFDIRKTVEFDQDLPGLGSEFLDEDIDNSGFLSVGIGYKRGWLRGDLTAEIRGTEAFAAVDEYLFDCDLAGLTGFAECGGGGIITRNNFWRGSLTSQVFLANAYFDMGNYHGFTPYVGAGAGFSRNHVDSVTDVDPGALGGGGSFKDNTEWSFAYALHAGLAYEVTENLTMDIGYRYLDFGDAKSGSSIDLCGQCEYNGLELDDLTAHEVKLGMRWMFGGGEAYYDEPELLPIIGK